jgi:hypothetical protein
MVRLGRTPPDQTVLQALHERDVEAVFGTVLPNEWGCIRCGTHQLSAPAAYLKQDGTLRAVCAPCLLELSDEPPH